MEERRKELHDLMSKIAKTCAGNPPDLILGALGQVYAIILSDMATKMEDPGYIVDQSCDALKTLINGYIEQDAKKENV